MKESPRSHAQGFLYTFFILHSNKDRPVAHAAGGGDGREEGRQRGHDHLHRNFNNVLLHNA